MWISICYFNGTSLLMIAGGDLTSDEKRAQDQFAPDYADQIRPTRDAMGARSVLMGFVT